MCFLLWDGMRTAGALHCPKQTPYLLRMALLDILEDRVEEKSELFLEGLIGEALNRWLSGLWVVRLTNMTEWDCGPHGREAWVWREMEG